MTANFSPAPWKPGDLEGSVVDSQGRTVALCYGEQWQENLRLIAAVPELLEACLFVKALFQKLEDDTEPNDPLLEIRKIVHAPIYKVLDAAISKTQAA
jgi:hypothetical protein